MKKAHAREAFCKYLSKCGCTEENLEDSLKGEIEESTNIYKDFEKTARDEGFEDIADFYKELQEVEAYHAKKGLKDIRKSKGK